MVVVVLLLLLLLLLLRLLLRCGGGSSFGHGQVGDVVVGREERKLVVGIS